MTQQFQTRSPRLASRQNSVLKVRAGLVVGALAAASAVGFACVPETAEVQTVKIVSKSIARADGGEVAAASGDVAVVFPPRVFIADTQITIIETPATDLGNAALSSRVSVSSSAESVIGFAAKIRFSGVGDTTNIAPENLVVAVGKAPYDTFLVASEDGNAVTAEISSLGEFVLVDRGLLEGGQEPEGEPDGEPEGGPEGNPEVSPEGSPEGSPGANPEGGPDEFGQCSDSCLSESGLPCCTTCGCSGACTPLCPSGTDWDCELSCCFDREATSCADI